MPLIKFDVTFERLREVLSYDTEGGVFTWRVTLSRRAPAGTVAGAISKHWGYRVIGIDGRGYRAARLAWMYVHGRWPEPIVDHINGYRADDRITNLRQATATLNLANSARRVGSKNPKGTHFHRRARKWSASITCAGIQRHLGLFETAEEAHAAYRTAAHEAFQQFARTA